MSLNIQYEAQLIILSFLTGVLLMISYDMLRTFRIFVTHRWFFVGIEDVIYWVYAGVITFSLLYRQNDGGLRGYVIIGVFIGMVVYNGIISIVFVKQLIKFSIWIRISLQKIIHARRKP